MWQRFTERARKVVFYAQEEAQKFGEGYVSTEHLLLGLVREGDSTAVQALRALEVEYADVRKSVEKQLPRGESRAGQDMTLTPRAKRVIDLAYDEARNLNNNYIGTEHLLLGLIREGDGLAGRVLAKLGVELEKARREVMALQAASPAKKDTPVQLVAKIQERFGFAPVWQPTKPEETTTETENATIWERCTPRARAVIAAAQADATARGAIGIGAEHLVLALLNEPECRGMQAMIGLGADLDRVRRAAEGLATVQPAETVPDPMPFSTSGQNAVTAAHVASIGMRNSFLGTEHLALVLFGGAVGEFADPQALASERVREAMGRSQAEE